jgi:glycosyltransferase involved in cell wall biosynthesis
MSSNTSQLFTGVSIVIPCFNEAPEVLQSTIKRTRDALSQITHLTYEIIVVDDGSTKYRYQGLSGITRIIRHSINKGYGRSLKTGISNASHDYIGIIDADNTYSPEDFCKMITLIPEHDMVVGARPWASISFLRRIPKRCITSLASFVAAYPIPDLNSGMRLFHKDIYESKKNVFPDKFSFSSTLTMVGLTCLFNVTFIPISYGVRTGKSKISPLRDTIRFTMQILRLSLYFQPLRFFIPLAILFVLLATLRGIRDVVTGNQLGGLALILFFMSFQTFFFGLIAEIINKKQ